MLALKWEEHGFTGDGPHENWPRNLANQISGQLAFDPKWLDSLNMLKYVEITSNHLKSPIITLFSWVFVCFWSPPPGVPTSLFWSDRGLTRSKASLHTWIACEDLESGVKQLAVSLIWRFGYSCTLFLIFPKTLGIWITSARLFFFGAVFQEVKAALPLLDGCTK